MTDLTEFLLARIVEDEVAARAASPGSWCVSPADAEVVTYPGGNDEDDYIANAYALSGPQTRANAAHIARHHPARVLAECAAKRRIVEQYADHLDRVRAYRNPRWSDAMNDQDRQSAREAEARHAVAEGPARLLALPYADHPDYRSEWAP